MIMYYPFRDNFNHINISFLKILFIFSEGEDKEMKKHWCQRETKMGLLPACRDQTHNSDMYHGQEWNWRLLTFHDTQPSDICQGYSCNISDFII